MEMPGNFKQIYFNMVFWLQSSHEIQFLRVFEEIGFSRRSLSCAVIFRAVFLWSFLTIRIRIWQSLSDSFHFLPEFCFSEEVFPSFSNAVFTFETALLATPNNSVVFVTRAPATWTPTIWTLLNSDRSAILMNFNFIWWYHWRKNKILVK